MNPFEPPKSEQLLVSVVPDDCSYIDSASPYPPIMAVAASDRLSSENVFCRAAYGYWLIEGLRREILKKRLE